MKKGFRLIFSIIRTILSLSFLAFAIFECWLEFYINDSISASKPILGVILLIIGIMLGIILFIISAYLISPIFWRKLKYKAKLLTVQSQEEYEIVMKKYENSLKPLKKFFIW